jgi:negative regulator of flagellin synthesis FlgM
MKITRTSEPARVDRTQPSKGGTSKAGAPSNSAGGSQLQSAAASSRLTQLEAQFSQSGFDACKVDQIRSAISDGRYQVNAGAVADKLLASAAQLAGYKA